MTCMPTNYTAAFLGNTGTCTLGGFPEYTVNVSTVAQVQLAVNFARSQNIRLVIKNTGHDFGAKSTGKGGLNIWTHHLKSSQFYPKYQAGSYNGPAFKLGAGIQVYEANKLAKDNGVTLVGGEGKVRAESSYNGGKAADICITDCGHDRRIHPGRWPFTCLRHLGHGR